MVKRRFWSGGAIALLVAVSMVVGSSVAVAVVAAPKVTGFSPASAPVGATVTVSGTNFTGATQVLFNGTASTFKVDSDTKITVTVPAGATTGTLLLNWPVPGEYLGRLASASVFTVTGR